MLVVSGAEIVNTQSPTQNPLFIVPLGARTNPTDRAGAGAFYELNRLPCGAWKGQRTRWYGKRNRREPLRSKPMGARSPLPVKIRPRQAYLGTNGRLRCGGLETHLRRGKTRGCVIRQMTIEALVTGQPVRSAGAEIGQPPTFANGPRLSLSRRFPPCGDGGRGNLKG